MMRVALIALLASPVALSGQADACGYVHARLEYIIHHTDVIFDGVYLGSEPAHPRQSLLEWARLRDPDSPTWFEDQMNCRRFYRVTHSWKGQVDGLLAAIGHSQGPDDCDLGMSYGQRVLVSAERETDGEIREDEPIGHWSFGCPSFLESAAESTEELRTTLQALYDEGRIR